MILASVQVSILALGVIFLVLTILIGVIKALDHFLPYKVPQWKPKAATGARSESGQEEHLAAIQVALAHHLGRSPQSISIRNIQAK